MNNLAAFQHIKAIVLDMDGVLTDGKVLVTDQGEQLRSFSIRDGYVLQLAVKRGYLVAVISGSTSAGAEKRFAHLGIQHVFMGVKNKLAVLTELLQSQGISLEQTLFMGDDIPDLDVMLAVGLAACPLDAVPEIQAIAQYISPIKGGDGCVRDVLEKIVKLQGQWKHDVSIAAR